MHVWQWQREPLEYVPSALSVPEYLTREEVKKVNDRRDEHRSDRAVKKSNPKHKRRIKQWQNRKYKVLLTSRRLPAAVLKYWEEFDADDHVEELIEAKRNGFQGVPRASVLVKDAEAIDDMLKELADALGEVEEASA